MYLRLVKLSIKTNYINKRDSYLSMENPDPM